MSAVFSAYLGIRWKHLLIASQDIHISWDPFFQKGHFTISEVSCSHGPHWAILRLCSHYTGWHLFACWHEKLTGLAWTAKAQNCNKSFTQWIWCPSGWLRCELNPHAKPQKERQSYRKPTFCLPGNLNLALLKASIAAALLPSLVLTDMMTWPMLTRATVPWGLPKAPRIPVWSL